MRNCTNILLSIHPEYARAILSGLKKYEYRRKIPARLDDSPAVLYLYATHPVRRILGSVYCDRFIIGTREGIWSQTSTSSRVTRDAYDKYFEGLDMGYALTLSFPVPFKHPVNPESIIHAFRGPQSYRYLTPGQAEAIEAAAKK